MAASHGHDVGRVSYNGGTVGRQQLPGGSCNYRDLGNGAEAPICGCKRFWLNGAYGNGYGSNATDKAWCFCGHHACFHSAFSQQQGLSQLSFGAIVNGTTTVEGMLEQQPGSNAQTAQAEMSFHRPGPTGLGIQQAPSQPQQSINTKVWNALNEFARNQEDGPTSDTTSKLPSTACPSIAGEPRASPSRMLRERVQSRSMGPPVIIPHVEAAVEGGSEEYSATEVATPSANGTPDLRAFAAPVAQPRSSPSQIPQQPDVRLLAASDAHSHLHGHGPANRPQILQRDRPASHSPVPLANLHMSSDDMRSLVRTLSQRVEVLESLSFSQVPVDEIQEKFDLIDGRLLDLEQWRGECERNSIDPETAGPSNTKRRRLLPTETGSFSSDGSYDSAAAAHTEAVVLATLAANAETGPRIDALETRIMDLENAALPSFAQPWQVQVVLLPWGRDLPGVWFTALDATQQSMRPSTQLSEEWNGPPHAPTLSFKSSVSGAWTTESIEAWAHGTEDWLSPKACGPGGQVFQRLASRGLVQEVTLTSPDSHHVLRAIGGAFRHIPGQERHGETHGTDHLGLQESLVPLRKVRKSTRLRFLSASEMATSALWTAGFLDASACMKVNDGQRRLYITAPDAYLQQNDGWSWQELKQLPIYDARGDEQAAQADSRLIEACWSYNDRLDRVNSTNASFAASHKSYGAGNESQTPAGTSHRLPSPTQELRRGHKRAVSLPSSNSAPELERSSVPKRRVASFETVGTVPMSTAQPSLTVSGKRRRISNSPEAERRGVGFTPRWSREPPSPYPSEGEVQSQSTSSRRRGMTPFAYATPHSNSHHAGPTDDDTEADTDIALPESENGDDEWQGVEEGMDTESRALDCESAGDEPEIS